MNLHHFRNAVRSLFRHSGFSTINMVGLTIALYSCLMIILYVKFEISFDRFHKNGANIYRVYMQQPGNLVAGSSSDWWVVSPAILKPTWEKELPEVNVITRTLKRQWVFRHEEAYVNEQILLVDPEFFDLFSFPLLSGNSREALQDPFSIVVSGEIAEKYFGQENPLGKTLVTNDSIYFTITGVLEEIPANSHLRFDFLVPLQSLEIMEGRSLINPDWTYNNSYETYLTLWDNTNMEEFDTKLRRYDVDGFNDSKWSFHLQPLYDIHFNRATGGSGSRMALFVFITVGLFILFIACFNYMNLSIVHQRTRIRGVALRKVMGATTGSFMRQFFMESLLLLFFAWLLSLLMVRLLLPLFNGIMEMELNFKEVIGLRVLLITALLIISMALISGVYPALYLSRLPLLSTLRGGVSKLSKGGTYFRKVVVVVQFSLSMALIIVSVTIFRQLRYLDQQDPGYLTENIMYIRLNVWAGIDWGRVIWPFKEELTGFPEVEYVAASTGVPTGIGWSNVPEWEGRDEQDKPFFYRMVVDYDFFELYGIRIAQGRGFSREMGSDQGNAYIINREAAGRMGLENPLGSKFGFGEQVGSVVGVIGDFYFESLHKPITPLGIGVSDDQFFSFVSVRLNGENIQQTLIRIKESWNRLAPGQPFEYIFMDDRMEQLYRKDRQLSTSMMVLSFMALFISCLGIFGLISFSLKERTREVGIRKVLGAAPGQMVALLTREIVVIISLATVAGGVVGWYGSRAWLSSFANRFEMGMELILISMIITLVMAIVPLGYRIVKSAIANPADSLRSE